MLTRTSVHAEGTGNRISGITPKWLRTDDASYLAAIQATAKTKLLPFEVVALGTRSATTDRQTFH
ncbi:MAG: hypothetical protein ACK5UX_17035 [Burkholderiales bacterium]|nr:hypothetical protein [Nitrosomonadaceae bacterium]